MVCMINLKRRCHRHRKNKQTGEEGRLSKCNGLPNFTIDFHHSEVGAHLFFLKKKWRFFHRKWWHFKWITDVGENIGERKGDILGELLEIVTFLSPFLTPFSVKFFSPNKVTISSPKMVSFLVSHKNWWIFWWRKRWFSKWIADREKFF